MKRDLFLKGYVLILCLLFASVALAGERVLFYHTDAAGTPLAMTDENGEVVWEADYLPFGEEHEVIESVQNKNRFIGKEKDKETDLNYFGARYLDARTGRFISTDQVGPVDPWTGKTNEQMLLNPQRLNKYSYGLNNPYKYVDSDGNWAEAVFIEGPSIAVGVHSLIDNLEQGNWGSATVDAGGIVADGLAVAAPGVPGGVGLGIKATRAANIVRKVASPIYKTTKEATKAANKLGFRKINETVHGGEAVFKRGKLYLTRDVDGHNGGAWKMADSVKNLASKKTRDGTYNHDLTRKIGD